MGKYHDILEKVSRPPTPVPADKAARGSSGDSPPAASEPQATPAADTAPNDATVPAAPVSTADEHHRADATLPQPPPPAERSIPADKRPSQPLPIDRGIETEPTLPIRAHHPNLVTLSEPDAFATEQFKQLRSRVLYPIEGTPPRTVMVTSAVPGEGKSFVTANLAISIAQNINEHVLLIDCDLRKPTIHRLFGYRGVRGLRDYLQHDADLSPLFLRTDLPKLTILPGGKPPRNPAELLGSSKTLRLLEEVKSRYHDRYIIIDSPPPLLTAETNVLARWVDAIILVLRAGNTKREMIADVIESIGKSKIIGAVFNWFDFESAAYYRYDKYGKYYGRRRH